MCHTLVGAAMGEAGLKRRTAFGMTTLLIGANLPDVDVVSMLAPHPASLGFRRGWTHGLLAIAVLPLVLTALLATWNALARRRAGPIPFSPRQVLLLATLAVVSHPALDFLNTYGMRWLMPFSGRWSYGDTLFIVDPWVWLALAAGVWWARRSGKDGRGVPRPGAPRAALVAVGAYVALMAISNVVARRVVTRDLAARGMPVPERLMIAPVPVTPFRREVVVAAGQRVWRGEFRWLREPRLILTSATLGADTRASALAARAAAATRSGQTYLSWARFPSFDIETGPSGCSVRIGDARYHQAAWAEAIVDVPVPAGGCG